MKALTLTGLVFSALSHDDDLYAYAQIGAGLKSWNPDQGNQQFDEAYQRLCQGAAHLKPRDADQQSLYNYILKRQKLLFETASNPNSSYPSTGWMRKVPRSLFQTELVKATYNSHTRETKTKPIGTTFNIPSCSQN